MLCGIVSCYTYHFWWAYLWLYLRLCLLIYSANRSVVCFVFDLVVVRISATGYACRLW